jgi:rare lipoprotein A
MMGLALSASGKDGSSASTALAASVKAPPPPPSPAVKAKPAAKPRQWLEEGIASWYGEKFQGRTTAGGELFDMNQMTCAHRTLPLGTWLRVTNLRNHRTAFVRVNDRGPILEDRIVDLSFAAAQTLGLDGVGLGQVRLEAVSLSDPDLALAMVAQLQMPSAFVPPAR